MNTLVLRLTTKKGYVSTWLIIKELFSLSLMIKTNKLECLTYDELYEY
jgi:hypothetical protein